MAPLTFRQRHIHRIHRQGPAIAIPVASILALVSVCAHGQSAGADSAAHALSIVPRFTVAETWTDNVGLVHADKQTELITEISPGVRIASEGARVRAYFDYALSGIAYARGSSPGRSQNALTTFGTVEAVDQWMYLDFNGSISQQAISAFGTQSVANTAVNANRTEVSSYRLSPYVRGRWGSVANYEARLGRTLTRGDTNAAPGVATSEGLLSINGDSAFRSLGWTSSLSRQDTDYSAGRVTESDRFDLGLTYAVNSQLSVFVNAGREFSNYTTLDKQGYNTHGVGVSWSPSERTRVSASQARRSFGDTHTLSLEHRTALTVWRFTDSQDVAVTPNQAELLRNSSTPVVPVISGFVSSAVSLQHRQDLSVSLQGVRDTVTLVATGSESRRLDPLSTAMDDLSTRAVRQAGFSVNYTHRVTPDYTLGLLASQQRTYGLMSLEDATLHFFNLTWSAKVGRRTTAALGARRTVYTHTAPYNESAITLNLTLQF